MAETVGQRGSTTCPQCLTKYKNNARPPVCTKEECGYPIGELTLITLLHFTLGLFIYCFLVKSNKAKKKFHTDFVVNYESLGP